MNSQSHAGQPDKPLEDQAVLTAPVIGPVTVGGWYDCEDGSRARFAWVGGRLTLMRVEASAVFLDRVAGYLGLPSPYATPPEEGG